MNLKREDVPGLLRSSSGRQALGWADGAMPIAVRAAAFVVWGCKPAAPPAPPPPVGEVMDLTTTNVPLSVEFIGQLDSPQNVEVRARVEAFVDNILFTEGTEVKSNAPLFALD